MGARLRVAPRYNPRRSLARCWRGKSPPRAADPPAAAAASRQRDGQRGSSLHVPGGGAVLVVLKLDAHGVELVADAIGLFEVLCFTGGVTRINQRLRRLLINLALSFRPLRETERPERGRQCTTVSLTTQGV